MIKLSRMMQTKRLIDGYNNYSVLIILFIKAISLYFLCAFNYFVYLLKDFLKRKHKSKKTFSTYSIPMQYV